MIVYSIIVLVVKKPKFHLMFLERLHIILGFVDFILEISLGNSVHIPKGQILKPKSITFKMINKKS